MGNRAVRRSLLSIACLGAWALVAHSPAAAQFDSFNVSLYSWIDLTTFGAGSGNDCWGYVSPSGREYALMGLRNKVAFVDITDPANPVWFGTIAHSSSTWCDIKVYRDHAYIVTETATGIQVVDMSDIDNLVVTLVRTINSPSRSHNIAVDTASGYIYTSGSRGGSATTVIFDVSDPANPVEVGTWNGASEHDIQIVTYTSGPYAGRQIMFGASGGRGLDVIDVTNKSNTFLISRTPYPSVSYCHQVWTEDLQYLYINDELDNIQRTTVFDISDLANPVFLGDYSSGLAATDHNNYVRNGIIYEADYHSGLRIYDLNVDPVNPPQIGWFDTYPEDNSAGFDGAWSTYPFFPSGTVIVSDINRGLFILDVSQALGGLVFEYPNGQPEIVDPTGGTRMRVLVSGRGGTNPQPGTGVLHYSVGGEFFEIPMEQISDNVYDAVFPAITCGTTVLYYVSAETALGQRFTDPSGAPGVTFTTLSGGSPVVVFEDDFETDKGWTVENIDLLDGAWERGVPVGGGIRGDPASDYDGSGSCQLTGNRAGNSDVDGGPTRLISPILDLSADGLYFVSYARWFYNDDVDEDRLDVEISNDGGATWVTVESVPHVGAWVVKQFTVNDFVTPTATVRLRFSATDNPNNSVTEAALDAFVVTALDCGGGEVTVLPDSFSVARGLRTAGVLGDLFDSDDSYVDVRPWFVLSTVEAPVQVIVEGTSPNTSPSQLGFLLEAHTSIPNIGQKIELFNYVTATWELVDSRPATVIDSVVLLTISASPERFIEPATGAMKARISYKESGPILSYPWLARIDRAVWTIAP
ncbi:MAG: choice-of-anchor B family protein [Armatimonadetes bacterium]|nr:choice-of-anchor B family protein [Armatimonadota bacterium]